jgi:hypothetical protein
MGNRLAVGVRARADRARAAADAGDPDRARRLFARAEAIARRIRDPFQTLALADLARAATAAGDLDRGETIAGSMGPGYHRVQALAGLARAAAAGGDPDRAGRLFAEAETSARSITEPDERAHTLASLVETLAAAGYLHGARRLSAEVEAVARSMTDRYLRGSPWPISRGRWPPSVTSTVARRSCGISPTRTSGGTRWSASPGR